MSSTLAVDSEWPAESIAYARLSVARDGSTVGVDRQGREVVAGLERLGSKVVEWYVENDRSASEYATKPRLEWERMLAEIASGQHDGKGLAGWDQARLTRRSDQLEELVKACEAGGVNFIFTTDGSFTASGSLLIPRIKTAVAAEESRRTSERILSMHRELAELGYFSGGRRPYGYQLQRDDTVLTDSGGRPRTATRLVIDEAEAANIRSAAECIVAGETVRSIVTDWNARGITTTSGGRWYRSSLIKMLQSPRLIGQRLHRVHGNAVGTLRPAEWEPILTEDVFTRVGAILGAPDRRSNRTAGRTHLLTGFLVCGRCGADMTSNAASASDRSRSGYACKRSERGGCSRLRVVGKPLEEDIVARLLTVMDRKRLRAVAGVVDDDDTAGQLAELAETETNLAELTAARFNPPKGRRPIGDAEYWAAREPLEARAEAIRAALANDARRQVVPVVTDAGQWDALTFEQRREVIGEWIESITIFPAARRGEHYHQGRAEVLWRH